MEQNQQNKEASPKLPARGTKVANKETPKQTAKSKSKDEPEAVQATAAPQLGLVVVTH